MTTNRFSLNSNFFDIVSAPKILSQMTLLRPLPLIIHHRLANRKPVASVVWPMGREAKDLFAKAGRFAARFNLRRTEGLPSICVVSLGAGRPICAEPKACAASLRALLDLRRIEGRFASPGRSASPVCGPFELRRTECFFANQADRRRDVIIKSFETPERLLIFTANR
jgi:hypothetical protein